MYDSEHLNPVIHHELPNEGEIVWIVYFDREVDLRYIARAEFTTYPDRYRNGVRHQWCDIDVDPETLFSARSILGWTRDAGVARAMVIECHENVRRYRRGY